MTRWNAKTGEAMGFCGCDQGTGCDRARRAVAAFLVGLAALLVLPLQAQAQQAADATLKDLALEDGNRAAIALNTVFDPSTLAYTASVPNQFDTVTLTAEKNDAVATVAITDDDDAATPDEAEFNLVVGPNTLTVTVTAEDITTTRAYTIMVTRAAAPPAPTDCPVGANWCATMRVGIFTPLRGFVEVYSGYEPGGYGDLGSRTFSHDGQDYTVDGVWRYKQSVRNRPPPPLHHRFAIDVDLPDETVVQVGDLTYAVDADSGQASQGGGEENWNLLADNPPDWTDGQLVTVSVTLPVVSDDATLRDLALEGGNRAAIALNTVFDPSTLAYTASVPNQFDTVTLTAEKNDAVATVAITDDDDAATPDDAEFNLVVGPNTLTVTVTAEDITTTRAYTIMVTRAAAPPAPTDCPAGANWCATMRVGIFTPPGGGLVEVYSGYEPGGYGDLGSRAFSHDGQDYTVDGVWREKDTSGGSVSDHQFFTSIDVTAPGSVALPDDTVVQVGSLTYVVSGTSGTFSSGAGNEGWSVLADDPPDWTDGQLVTVSVTFPAATDAALSGLALTDASDDGAIRLNQTFAPNVTTYTADVAYDMTPITIAPTPRDDDATIAYLDASDGPLADADLMKDGHQAALMEGENTFKVRVTAEDGNTTRTYTVTVTRAGIRPPLGVLVSNRGQTRKGVVDVGQLNGSQQQYAQEFTTGSAPGGYWLDDVRLSLEFPGDDAEAVITLRAADTADGSNPSATTLYTLTSASVLCSCNVIFEAPPRVFLEKDTGYFVVIENANTTDSTAARYNVARVSSNHEDGGALPGWTIGNTGREKFDSSDWHDISGSRSLKIQVRGAVRAASDDATLSGLTVNDGTTDHPIALATPPYALNVGNAVDEVTLTAMLNDAGATVSTVTLGGNYIGDSDFSDGIITVSDLVEGDNTIVVTVTAENADTRDYTLTVTVLDNDTAQVTGVMVTEGNGQLVVEWTAVSNATGYRVQWKSGGEDYNTGDRQATVTSGSTTSHTIVGLANGAEYTVRVIATRSGANDGPPSAEVMGMPEEPTAPGVTVSGSPLTVTEEDTTGDSYTVVLDTEPTADVTVTVAGHAGTDVTPNPTTLTFTSLDWDTPRTVTVTADNDGDTDNETVTLTHSAASSDGNYSSIAIPGVMVTVLDNDTAASGAPEITGAPMDGSGDPEPQHGLTLTVDTTGISDADGLTAPGYMYQWIRVDGSNEDDIPGATVATYTAVLADVGMKLKVKVIFTDDGGAAETLTSMATASVVAQSVISFRSSTASVTEGDVQGVLLTLDLSPHARGSGTVQLLSEGQNGATPADYRTNTSVDFTPGDLGRTIEFVAHDDVDDDDGESVKISLGMLPPWMKEGADAEATVTLIDTDNTPATGAPVISGTAQVGEVLTADTGGIADADGLTSPGYTWQWLRVDSDGVSNETMIGANAGAYTLVAADAGGKIRVRVSFTDDTGNPEALTSDAWPAGAATINTAPVFAGVAPRILTLTETVGDATVAVAANIGAPVAATDADGDTLEYTLGGPDMAKFGIVLPSGQIQTGVGESYDYEAKTSYSVTVTADDRNGGTALIAVTINVNDLEPPLAPDAPVVTTIMDIPDSLIVEWTQPDNTDRPAITGYDLRYRKTTENAWIAGPGDESGLMAFILNLVEDTEYEVQVRATNGEGDSPWSQSGTGTTDALPALSFVSVNVEVAENEGVGMVGVELDRTSLDMITVDYQTQDSTAVAGVDYTATMGTLTFAPGVTSQAITIPILDNDTFEAGAPGSFRVMLGNPAGATLDPSSAVATVSIRDDEGVPMASIADVTAGEGGTMRLTLTLDHPSSLDTAYGATAGDIGGTATRGVDYEDDFLTGGSVSFTVPAGDLSATLAITITDDMVAEDDETITIRWTLDQSSNRGEATPVSLDFTGAITDDDAAGVTVSETALTVTEEDTTGDSYTVVLDSRPTADVMVTVAAPAGTDVTPTPTPLIFTSLDWDTPRTVTVTAVSDADTANDTVTLTHSATSSDGDYSSIAIPGVTVTVLDNDTAQVTGVMVTEGNGQLVVEWTAVSNATGYRVQWKSGGEDYNTGDRQATVTPGSTTSHTIVGLANGAEYTVRVIATRSGANDGPPSAEVMGTPEEPTAPGVTVSGSPLTVTEEDTTGDSYTVVLDTEPTADVTVTVAGHAGTDVTPNPTTLTFTSLDWDTPRTVTVTADNDGDTDNETVTLTHSAASSDGNYSSIAIPGVMVTVLDNDTAASGAPEITGAPMDGSGDPEPQHGLTLTVDTTGISDADGLTAPGYMYQWIRVDGSNEDDIPGATVATYTAVLADVGMKLKVKVIFTDDGGAAETLTSMATASVVAQSVISFRSSTASVTEGDVQGVLLTLDLSPHARGSGTVQLLSEGQNGATPADYRTNTSVDFTPGDLGRTIEFVAHDDVDDDDGESVKISLGMLPPWMKEGADAEATVTLIDTDNTPATGAPVISGTAQVGEVLTADTGGIADADGLTSPGYTWQWLRVDSDGVSNETMIGANAGAYTLVAADAGGKIRVRVSFTDDTGNPEALTSDAWPAGAATINTAPVFAGVAPRILTLTETVGDATVAVAANIGAPVAATDADGDTLEYTLGGPDMAKFGIVLPSGQIQTGVGESYDYEAKTSYSVTVTADDRNGGTALIAVTINVNDLEPPLAPDAPVVTTIMDIPDSLIVEWTQPDNTDRPAITGYDLRYRKTTENAWIAGPGDESGLMAFILNLVEDTEYEVQVRATNGEGDSPWSQSGTGTTDALPALSFVSVNVEVAENEGVGMVGVELDRTSLDMITVDYQTQDSTAVAGVDYTATMGTLTFAPGVTSQAITIPILDNDTFEAGAPGSFRVMLGNPAGATLDPSSAVATVSIRDDEGVPMASIADVTAGEGGTMRLTLTLDHPSSLDTAYGATAGDIGGTATRGVDYEDDFLTGGSVSFTVPAGDLSATLAITITDDMVAEDDETITIRWTLDQSSNRGEATPVSLDFTGAITDDDAAGVTVSETALTVTEEDTTGDSYTVVLDSRPTADVMVTVAAPAGTDVTPTPTPLIFTSLDWDTPRTVTVTAVSDADTANDTVTLTHSATSSDGDYSSIAIPGVTVTVLDNDTAQVTGVMVTEGNGQLVVEWTAVSNATGYRVQWKSGGEDYNTGDRQATVTPGSTTSHTIGGLANGAEYTVRVIATRSGANDGPPSAEVMGTPEEPTAPGVTVSESALTVTEEDTTGDSYTVVLDTEPTADVTVTVAGHAGTDVTPNPTTLTFTSLDWNTPQDG